MCTGIGSYFIVRTVNSEIFARFYFRGSFVKIKPSRNDEINLHFFGIWHSFTIFTLRPTTGTKGIYDIYKKNPYGVRSKKYEP